jgi:NADH-quinone oxidoreductase subunit H
VFNAAPVVMYIPALLVLAVIPWGTTTFLADLNIGILYIIAITSLSTFAVVMAGWGSQNRYAMFGAMRAVALLISYEIPMALSLLGVLMFAGSMSLVSIVAAQDIPFVLLQPLGFLVFLIAATAEINRAPFDLAEAESELGAGYHSDYSGMKFGMFLNAEFTAAMISAAILVALFFAGGRGPFLPSPVWFVLKMMIILFIMIWTRVTWPRLRIDQVLAFAWKGLLALAFINLVASAILIYVWPDPSIAEQWIIVGINWAIMIASVTVIGKLLAPTMTPAVTFATESSLPRPTMAGQSAGGGD